MPSRHRSRQRALQILFQMDLTSQTAEDAIAAYYGSLYSEENEEKPEMDVFAGELIRGTASRLPEIDRRIIQHSENWKLERMPAVDRNILRMAIYEMAFLGTAPAVAINEALELARRFSGDDSVPFINGLLDAVRQDLEQGEARA